MNRQAANDEWQEARRGCVSFDDRKSDLIPDEWKRSQPVILKLCRKNPTVQDIHRTMCPGEEQR